MLTVPTIAIEAPESWDPLDRALDRVADYRWLVFTSANGVAMVRQRLAGRGVAGPGPARLRVAAIGPATAAALRDWGVHPDVVPEEYVAEGLAARLRELIRPGDRVLLPRAAETRDVLVRELEAMGAHVDEVAAYRTRPAAAEAGELRAALLARRGGHGHVHQLLDRAPLRGPVCPGRAGRPHGGRRPSRASAP